MVKKRGIKVNVHRYIKEHHGKGHSLGKIRKWLLAYGYDAEFVSKIIKNFQRNQFIKKVSLSSFIVAVTLLFVSLPAFNTGITGAVTASQEGCCIDNEGICHSSYSTVFCNSVNFMHIRYGCLDLPYCENNTGP